MLLHKRRVEPDPDLGFGIEYSLIKDDEVKGKIWVLASKETPTEVKLDRFPLPVGDDYHFLGSDYETPYVKIPFGGTEVFIAFDDMDTLEAMFRGQEWVE